MSFERPTLNAERDPVFEHLDIKMMERREQLLDQVRNALTLLRRPQERLLSHPTTGSDQSRHDVESAAVTGREDLFSESQRKDSEAVWIWHGLMDLRDGLIPPPEFLEIVKHCRDEIAQELQRLTDLPPQGMVHRKKWHEEVQTSLSTYDEVLARYAGSGSNRGTKAGKS